MGTKRIATRNLEYKNFQEAKDFAKKLRLDSKAKWFKYCKSGKKPIDIPGNPSITYKDSGWKGWGDWLGTGTIAPQDILYRNFNDAKDFVKNLNLKTGKDWKAYCQSGNKPKDIPNAPQIVYKEWKGTSDFLGNNKLNRNLDFLNYEDAKKIVHNLKLKTIKEWNVFSKNNRTKSIPGNPSKVYKSKGWKNWGDWLGTGVVSNKNKIFLTYNESKKFVHKLQLRSQKEWNEYCSKNTRPSNIPRGPAGVYKNKGWINWQDFLGKK